MNNFISNNLILPKYLILVKKKGSSLALPANGLGGSRATSLLVAHFAKRNTKFGSGGKARISFSVRSQIVCCEFIASALRASAGRLYSICQDFFGSIATFCESKTRFAVAKQRINKVYEPILFIPPSAENKAIIFNSPKAI